MRDRRLAGNVTRAIVQLGRDYGKVEDTRQREERSVLVARFREGVYAVDFDDRWALGQVGGDNNLVVSASA